MTKDLIDTLEDLRLALNDSGVERTAGLKAASGLNCRYYRKSRELFLDKDYDMIKKLFELALEQFELIEGPDGLFRKAKSP